MSTRTRKRESAKPRHNARARTQKEDTGCERTPPTHVLVVRRMRSLPAKSTKMSLPRRVVTTPAGPSFPCCFTCRCAANNTTQKARTSTTRGQVLLRGFSAQAHVCARQACRHACRQAGRQAGNCKPQQAHKKLRDTTHRNCEDRVASRGRRIHFCAPHHAVLQPPIQQLHRLHKVAHHILLAT